MTDHRRLQRTLFRMQLDPSFAAALRRGDEPAVRSVGLDEDALSLLLSADPAGIEADAGGERRAQFLGNVASEFVLSTWVAARAEVDPGLLETFTSSDDFHRCIAEDGRLPLAFAEHARARASAAGDALLSAFVELEAGLSRLRRGLIERPAPCAGDLILAPRALVLDLPAGAHDAAAHLKQSLAAGTDPGALPRLAPAAREHVLLTGRAPSAAHGLASVEAEPLSELPAALLTETERPMGAARRAWFCRTHDVEEDDLNAFVDSLVADGVLVVG